MTRLSGLDEYVWSLPYVSAKLPVLPPPVVHARRKLGHDAVVAFRNAVKPPKGYQIHHIVPLHLGGELDRSNLCAIDPALHKAVHRIIEKSKQPNGVVRIPYATSQVWHQPNAVKRSYRHSEQYAPHSF